MKNNVKTLKNKSLLSTIIYPQNHIYNSKGLPAYYDHYPWAYIAHITKIFNKNSLQPLLLVDIGANVGDTAAMWREYFSTKVICVEPDDRFFEMLVTNAEKIGNCITIKGLFNAGLPVNQLEFNSNGGQTGNTKVIANNMENQEEHSVDNSPIASTVSVKELLDCCHGSPAVFKTDTDGFDLYILRNLNDELSDDLPRLFPVIFSEGPTQDEYSDEKIIGAWFREISRLLNLGYNLTIFTNFGHPYAYCGQDILTVKSCFYSMAQSIHNRKRVCHYFDLIFTAIDDAAEFFDMSPMSSKS